MCPPNLLMTRPPTNRNERLVGACGARCSAFGASIAGLWQPTNGLCTNPGASCALALPFSSPRATFPSRFLYPSVLAH